MLKTCEQCGKEFNALRNRNKYCGKECYIESKRYSNNEQLEKAFKERFESKFKNHEYHSGFTTSEGYFKSKCKICGSVQERAAQCTRPRNQSDIKCDNCISLNQTKKQLIRKLVNTLNKDIKDKEKYQKQLATEESDRAKRTSVCNECGEVFTGTIRGMKYCSIKCANKHSNRIKDINRRRKLKNNGRIDWSITLDKLIKRDKNVCHICKDKCDKKDYKVVDGNFIVGKEYPSIDHLVPVNKGGTHSWDNIKLAHHHCNAIKRDNDIYETSTRQLVMAI